MSDSIIQRIRATAIWESDSIIHIGGAEDSASAADMMLARDAKGQFYIPGASIVGAARSFLAAGAKMEAEPAAMRALFGGGSLLGTMSALFVADADLTSVEPGEKAEPLIRDGVRINSATGVAARKAKFAIEALPPRSQFSFSCSLMLYDEFHGAAREEVLTYFAAFLDAFSAEGVRLGARTRRGFGRGHVSRWDVRTLSMKDPHDVRRWLLRRWEEAPLLDLRAISRPTRSTIETMTIDATLRLESSILIRKAGTHERDPDYTHLTERDSLVPGSSLAGAIRHRCERIAKTVLSEKRAESLITQMFGPAAKGDDEMQNQSLFASKIETSDAPLRNGTRNVQGRVTIDRFTGGAMEARLFDEAAFWPDENAESHIDVNMRLQRPSDAEAGLLLLAFKDLWLGDLPVGGEIGVGRGIFRGVSATVRHPRLGILEYSKAGPAALDMTGWERLVKALHAVAPDNCSDTSAEQKGAPR